jgi:hypothetical protein
MKIVSKRRLTTIGDRAQEPRDAGSEALASVLLTGHRVPAEAATGRQRRVDKPPHAQRHPWNWHRQNVAADAA